MAIGVLIMYVLCNDGYGYIIEGRVKKCDGSDGDDSVTKTMVVVVLIMYKVFKIIMIMTK